MSGVEVTGRFERLPWRAARRGQSGYTLLELIFALSISMLLIGPVTAWMILIIREQPGQADSMAATAGADVLRNYFADDVAVAGAADDYTPVQATGGRWDTWRQACAGGEARNGRELLVLLSQATVPVKVIYTVVPNPDTTTGSLYRTECGASTGVIVDEQMVMERVVTDPTRTRASCSPSTQPVGGTVDDLCRQVRLTIGTERGRSVELSATRRTDARSLDVDTRGNYLPIARIEVTSQEWVGASDRKHSTRVSLSAAGSSDPDGNGAPLTYAWELPSGASVDATKTTETVEVVLPSAGDYWVRLTVTDAAEATNSTYRRVTIANRTPLIAASITPLTARAGQDTLTLDASASSDLDGSVDTWAWTVTGIVDESQTASFSTATASFPVPTWAVGGLVVRLTITDDSGAVATATSLVEVLDPDAPDPDPDPDPNPDPDAPVASVAVSVGGGTAVTLNASGSQGSIVSWNWDLGLLAGTATGQVVNASYPGPGTYQARLTVTDNQGRTDLWTGQVVIAGSVAAPANVRTSGNSLVWDARAGARRYLVDIEGTSNGCAQSLLNQVVAASAAPTKALPEALCTGQGSQTRARVGVEGVQGGPISWSPWLDVTGAVPK